MFELVRLASRSHFESQVPALTHRGVPISLFRLFVKKVKKMARKHNAIGKLKRMSTSEVVKKLISMGFFKEPKLSFMETHSEKPRKPAYIVRHSWTGQFKQTIKSIEWWIDSRELPESTIIYWDVLSERVASDEPESSLQTTSNDMQIMIEDAVGFVFCWGSDGRDIMRLWLMHSMLLGFNSVNNILIDFASKSGCLACIEPFNGWMCIAMDGCTVISTRMWLLNS